VADNRSRFRVVIRHIVSCRGWSSDAYWAARAVVELERAGHDVTLVCKKSSQVRVMRRAKEAGIERLETLHLSSGLSPIMDGLDVRQLVAWLPETQVFHVHRGKEHWLAALANRMSSPRRAIVRTRHIVQPIRPHALNRWLYGSATDLIVTVTDAIRRQIVASGLAREDRVVALPGGVDAERYRPDVPPAHGLDARGLLKVSPDVPLIGLVGGFRIMKGHETVVAAAARLAATGLPFHLVFIGQGPFAERVRGLVHAAGLADRVSLVGFVDELPMVMAALDVALYAALESDGMSRVLWEYLAAAVPVVATCVGVVPEVLEDDVTALLVPAGESVPLAAAIERLLRDAALRRRLGAAGAELVREHFSGARLAERLTALYLSLAVDSARPAR
jgi:glycosyltransferase involved in cell wall biosynthesis